MKSPTPLSRRRFLQTGAAATVGLAAGSALTPCEAGPVPGQRAAQPKPKDDPFGGFTVGIQSYSYRNFNVENALTRINELGLRHVELYRGHVPLNATDAQIKAVKNIMTKLNITPIAFGVERFTKDNAANRRIFEFGRNLGVRYLTADPDPDSFESLDKLVAEFNIGIAIHPHGPTGKTLHRWYSAEVILAAVKNHHRLIGTCLDTGHLIRSAQQPFARKLDSAAQIRAMGARNFGLHLKDHDNEKRTDVVFGKGVLDVVGVLRALREVKFTGYIAIEYEANPANPTPDIRACVDVFKDAVRKLA
jgi:inosose dehydratase